MAFGDPDSPFRDDFYQHQRRQSHGIRVLLWILAAIAGICIFSCAGALFWLFSSYSGDGGEDQVAVDLPLEAFHAHAAAAFNGDDVGVGKRDFRRITVLLDALAKAVREDDQTAFRRLTDVDRLFEQIHRVGLARLNRFEAERMKMELRGDVDPPGNWQRYDIARIDLADNGNDALVYAYLWNDEDSISSCFWITRDGDEWKLYDWELLEYGYRKSRIYAGTIANADDLRLAITDLAFEDIEQAGNAIDDYEFDEAADHLLRAQSRDVLPLFRNAVLIRIGFAWSLANRDRDAVETFRKIKPPEAAPVTFYGQAIALQGLGKYEEALETAAKYEDMLGFNPKVTMLRAELLAEMGRTDEAAERWQRLLKFDPEDVDALASLAPLLADDEKDVIVEYLGELADPMDAIDELALPCYWRDDTALLETLVRYEKEHLPDSPHTEYLLGLIDEIDEQYEAAATHYRIAWEAEPDVERQNHYVENYLVAMSDGGKPIVGYENAPDPSHAFLYLAEGYEEQESLISRDQLVPLVAAHLRRTPDDPWAHYYQGVLWREDGRFDNAAEQFRTALKNADEEYLQSWWRDELARALFDAGHLQQAYQTLESPSAAFRCLAEHCHNTDRYEKLLSLVELHRAAEPNDELLDHYEALFRKQEGDLAEAERLLKRGYAAASDEDTKATYRSLWLTVRLESASPESAYRDIPDAADDFNLMANRLAVRERWPALRRLIDAHRAVRPADPQLVFQEVRLAWLTEDYKTVCSLLKSWPADKLADLETWQLSSLRDWRFRSLLRLDRQSDAMAAAREYYEDDDDPSQLAVVHALRKDADALAGLLDELAQSSFSLYADEDVGPLVLGDPVFRALRLEHPPLPTHFDTANKEAVLLLREPISWNADRLREAIKHLTEPATASEVTAIAPEAENSKHSFLVRIDEHALSVTMAGGAYDREQEVSDPLLRAALADHNAWLAVDWFRSSDEKAARSLARRLATALADEDCLAFYLDTPEQLVKNTPEFRQLMLNDPLASETAESGEYAWLYHDETHDPDAERALRAIRRGLRDFRTAFGKRKAEDEFLIQIALNVGHLFERHWLRVLRIETSANGSNTFVAAAATDSQLIPEFRQGELVRIGKYQILDWQYTADGRTVRAGDPLKQAD